MIRFFLFLYFCLFSYLIRAENQLIHFSDDCELNMFIQEVFVEDIPIDYNPRKISICFGKKSASTGKYYNYIRVGDQMKGPSGYVEVLSFLYDTYEEAIQASKDYKGIFESEGGFIKCDFTTAPDFYQKTFICNHKDITILDNAPSIKQYMQKNKLLIETKKVKSKALSNAINGKDAYQCNNQFADLSKVIIYRNGKKVSPKKYTLLKQGKVVFHDGVKVKNGDVSFEYEEHTKYFKPIKNDLSADVSQFLDVHGGGKGKMYSFVKDPTGENRNVLMIFCNELQKETHLARQQFSLHQYSLTYFRDRIKLFVPMDMKEAFLSYPKAISWFSIQGSWCNFGSRTGVTNEMYSGSESSFSIVKLTPSAKDLYFNLFCRQRYCSTESGLEIYKNLNNEYSSFPVKCGEWITIEREWKVGNPGFCKHTIIDSDGRHEFFVEAYNCVCDLENESLRYGMKYAGKNPYNVFNPFICKIYTSKDFVEHCIRTIGRCYLYFKDYELLEAKNVNAFNESTK